MRPPQTVRGAEAFGRTRLSRTFFMRDFLFSEIAAIQGMRNLPANPDLAIQAGRHLCTELLEPLQATFGRIAIRSAYRSAQVNGFGNAHNLSCASNERDRARHIWDERDSGGHLGAMTTIVIPWLVDRLGPINRLGPKTTWQSIAWWIHDQLPYSELQFFPKLCAFNIAWHEVPKRTISSFVAPRGVLTKPGMANHDGDHSWHYPGFPQLVVPEPFSAT